ncbi:MAG: hypothetical protein JNL32_14980 [Candidatus Kapabacteria bacterium]|nr:hypothetical protein [Candidatus Kapabacteria bacterium]
MKTQRLVILLVGILFSTQGTHLLAQITNPTASGTLNINVARNASIQCSAYWDFGWMVKGQTKSVGGNLSPLLYAVRGEATAWIDVTFPNTLTLYKDGNPLNPSITFTRGTVFLAGSPLGITPPQASATDATPQLSLNAGQTGTFQLPGTVGIPGVGLGSGLFYWVGGSVTVPPSVPHGQYLNDYTVTISNYSI